MSLALFALSAVLSLPAQDAPKPAHDFEVLVLGTLHAPFQFRHPGFTPAHVEAVLRASKPDVIGVESNPTWFARDDFYPVTYEAQGIAVPFARERDLPVYGIDWMSIESWDRRVQARVDGQRVDVESQMGAGPMSAWAFGRLSAASAPEFDAYLRNPDLSFVRMNGIEGDLDDSKFMPPGDPTSADWGGERNQRIYGYCLDAMKAHPGKRLVVVIGAGHKPVLDALFGVTEGVRLLELGQDVPMPSADDLETAWTPQHLTATLGHNLDGERVYLTPGLVDLARMSKLAGQLGEMRGQAPIATYYRGRIAYEDGRYADAMGHWDSLGETFGQWNPYPFPMDHWRMRYGWPQSIRVERARTLLALDRRDEALEVLEGLEDRLPPVPELIVSEGARDALADAGFELGAVVAGGWRNDDVLSGAQRARLDDDAVEGEHSLRIDVVRPREHGLSALTQVVSLDEATRKAGTFELSVRVRSKGIDHVLLKAYRWIEADRRMDPIAGSRVELDGERWTTAKLDVAVPDGVGAVHLFLYYPGVQGTTIWFDDARTFSMPEVTTPEEWGPRTLAREFVRHLRAHGGSR